MGSEMKPEDMNADAFQKLYTDADQWQMVDKAEENRLRIIAAGVETILRWVDQQKLRAERRP